MMAGMSLAVFSQSDIEFLNSQKNYETRLQQARIDCEQRIRDAQDALRSERDTLSSNLNSQSSQLRQCSADLQRFTGSQSTFLARLGQLVSSNPNLIRQFPAGAVDQNGSIVDLNAAFDVIAAALRGGDQTAAVDGLRRDLDSCRRDSTRFQSSVQEIQVRLTAAEGRANDCVARSSQNENAARQASLQLTTFQQNLSTCQAELQNARKVVEESNVRVLQFETNLNACNQRFNTSGQDISSLRGKLQFLFDVSGYCRQNFFNLANDKNAVSSAFADLSTFVSQLGPLTSIPGSMEDKINVLASERASFRRRVELIGVVLTSLFAKVDDYSRVLRSDGYDSLTSGSSGTGSGQTTYGSWVFNPSADGVDINNLATVDSCKAAVATLKEKMTVLSSNLNTAVRNNNECLKKFNEASSFAMIGAGYKEDF